MSRYIDAELAEAAMTKLYEEDVEMYVVEIPETFDKGRAISELRKIPAADVEEVKHATWECIDESDNVWECSGKDGCGELFILDEGTPEDNRYKRCPNCGAKMDGKEKTDGET